MPRYNCLNVLEYECELLRCTIDRLAFDIQFYQEERDLFAGADTIISLNSRRIAELTPKLMAMQELLDDFSENNNIEEYISDEPLEFLYQDFLKIHLNAILSKIEKAYENHVNYLMAESSFPLTVVARKIAFQELKYSTVDKVVTSHIQNERIKELSTIPKEYKMWYSAPEAINKKYDYFLERIVCCVEIGNKIRSLA